ncbi:MAG: prolipoprotein diacylglyceryl transferase [Acidobacteria bacterium]|nr:prolipoprotein diacylglyceryl transferase [Acidobacteriota bacterium]
MIEIYIDPNLAQLGPFTVSWHGLFTAVGLLVAMWLALRLATRMGVTEDDVLGVATWAVPGGIVGARLFHVIDQWGYYSQNPVQIFLLNEGGIAIYGAIIGGTATGILYATWRKLPIGRLADVGAFGLITGMAIGRLGDIINGEHHGKPTDGPWSVSYTHPNTLGESGQAVHLAVGYELLWDLAVFALLVQFRRSVPRPGVLFLLYLVLYSVGRFWISFFRQDTIMFLGLSQAQIVAVLSIAVAFALWYRLIGRIKAERGRSPAKNKKGLRATRPKP